MPKALAWSCALWMAAATASGHGQGRCEGRTNAGHLAVAVELPDDLMKELRQRVQKGLTVRLVHQIQATNGMAKGELNGSFGCALLFDPWDDAITVNALRFAADRPELVVEDTGRREKLPGHAMDKLPFVCLTGQVNTRLGPGDTILVQTLLDPTTKEQAEVARRWLAEKGISLAAPNIIGRAVAALIEVDTGKTTASQCVAVGSPAAPATEGRKP